MMYQVGRKLGVGNFAQRKRERKKRRMGGI